MSETSDGEAVLTIVLKFVGLFAFTQRGREVFAFLPNTGHHAGGPDAHVPEHTASLSITEPENLPPVLADFGPRPVHVRMEPPGGFEVFPTVLDLVDLTDLTNGERIPARHCSGDVPASCYARIELGKAWKLTGGDRECFLVSDSSGNSQPRDVIAWPEFTTVRLLRPGEHVDLGIEVNGRPTDVDIPAGVRKVRLLCVYGPSDGSNASHLDAFDELFDPPRPPKRPIRPCHPGKPAELMPRPRSGSTQTCPSATVALK
jgi:hypothetical protein